MTPANHFELLGRDGQARTGRLMTPHGAVRTPAFMPVGTAGAMKGLHWREVRDAGADIVLGNTYHLMLRPGAERIAALGGLQTFTGWNGHPYLYRPAQQKPEALQMDQVRRPDFGFGQTLLPQSPADFMWRTLDSRD
jgi:hypothetical protein